MDDEERISGRSRTPLGPAAWAWTGDLSFTFTRARGPGGQAVNKVSSAAQLRVPVSAIQGLSDRAAARLRRLAGQRLTVDDVIVIQARTHRSQLGNRRACLRRLCDLVDEALREPKPRKKSKPTKAMIRRRLAAKRIQSEKKKHRRRPSEE